VRGELLGPEVEEDDDEESAGNGRHRRSLRTPVILDEDVQALPGRHYRRL
jgi:hypothetical protein